MKTGRRSDITKENTFTDRLRKIFKGILDPIAGGLLRIGLTPNAITLFGLVGHFIAAGLIIRGHFVWAGLTLILFAPLDALDGAMARQLGVSSHFGAFLDSVTDRYAELVLYGGLLVHFHLQGRLIGIILAYVAIAGSFMVSYTRSRAETLGYSARIGLFSRVERYLVLLPMLLFRIPEIGLWILAIFTQITAIQRILHVRKQALTDQHGAPTAE